MLKKLIDFINKAVSLSKFLGADWMDAETKAAVIAEFASEAEELKREVKNVLR